MVESVLGRRVGVYCNFIIHFLFLLFLVFHGAGGVGGEFTISQLIWGILVSGSSILVVSPGGISTRFIGGRGGVDCFLQVELHVTLDIYHIQKYGVKS